MIKITNIKVQKINPLHQPKVQTFEDLYLSDSFNNQKRIIAEYIVEAYDLGKVTRLSGHQAEHVLNFEAEDSEFKRQITALLQKDE